MSISTSLLAFGVRCLFDGPIIVDIMGPAINNITCVRKSCKPPVARPSCPQQSSQAESPDRSVRPFLVRLAWPPRRPFGPLVQQCIVGRRLAWQCAASPGVRVVSSAAAAVLRGSHETPEARHPSGIAWSAAPQGPGGSLSAGRLRRADRCCRRPGAQQPVADRPARASQPAARLQRRIDRVGVPSSTRPGRRREPGGTARPYSQGDVAGL